VTQNRPRKGRVGVADRQWSRGRVGLENKELYWWGRKRCDVRAVRVCTRRRNKRVGKTEEITGGQTPRHPSFGGTSLNFDLWSGGSIFEAPGESNSCFCHQSVTRIDVLAQKARLRGRQGVGGKGRRLCVVGGGWGWEGGTMGGWRGFWWGG